jgi:hypothetical protein
VGGEKWKHRRQRQKVIFSDIATAAAFAAFRVPWAAFALRRSLAAAAFAVLPSVLLFAAAFLPSCVTTPTAAHLKNFVVDNGA